MKGFVCPQCGKESRVMVYPKDGPKGCTRCVAIGHRSSAVLHKVLKNRGPGKAPVTEAYKRDCEERKLFQSGQDTFVDRRAARNPHTVS